MEKPEKRFSDLVEVVKSWIPRRTEPANLSRDFWMPDHSCRVCYDCDSPFNLINRRHHCRHCGRVFCAKCTANSIPAPSLDARSSSEDRVRVCNYCFKQWQNNVAVDNATQLSSPGLSPSPSVSSLVSTKSSVTGNSYTTVGSSMPYSTGPYQSMQYGSSFGPYQSARMKAASIKQDMVPSERNMDSAVDIGVSSPNQFGFCINRSDDEDDEYGVYRSDTVNQGFQPSDGYYGQAEFDDLDADYESHKVHPTEESLDHRDMSSPVHESPDSRVSLTAERLGEEANMLYNGEECDAASSIYGVESAVNEPVDFENNGLLWLPPDPEDEEDERDAVLLDDDEEDPAGEWRQMQSPSSFSCNESRGRGEENQKAIKSVVEGHFRALVAQLLQVENLPLGEGEDKESWLDIVTSLSWEAATLLKPDTSKGGGMDPGGYVKVKCIACGHRSESEVVKGVVCKKNVAHRRMTSKIRNPRLLILSGALEYQRVSNLLSSLDTLLQQEMDHLKMAVAKIDAHQPDILLVEKSVSRFAQEYLLAKDISLVLNIKRPLLERIARCTGAHIVPSIDHLSSQQLGHCEMFHVEKYLEEHGSAGQGGKKLVKTLMFFEGCPKPLGYTILLKGATGDELKKVKHVVQYGVFAAYHLALETSFLADEGASLPELPLKSPITVGLPSNVGQSISTVPGFVAPSPHRLMSDSDSVESSQVTQVDEARSKTEENASYIPEGLSSSISEIPFRVSHLFRQMDRVQQFSKPSNALSNHRFEEKENFNLHTLLNTDYPVVHSDKICTGRIMAVSTDAAENQPSSLNTGRDPVYSQQEEQVSAKEEFPPSPSDHQSILVSLSIRCVWTGTVCERAHLCRIKYYGSFDKPLGRFLRDHLFDKGFQCRSCDMPTEAHVHCYTHRQGSLTISVKKLLEFFLPGEHEGKIWMWHRCLRCPRIKGFPPATQRIVMSDAAWGLSFGKFLELSFSNHAAASRVASCGHSLHRDCLRFYGFGNMVACFRYASINVHSVYLPPHKLDFNYQQQEWIDKEANEVTDGAELLFSEVLNAIDQIATKRPGGSSHNGGSIISESRRRIDELESFLQKEKAQFEESLQQILKKEPKKNQPVVDILEINWLRRHLLLLCYIWDRRLIQAASLENSKCEEENISTVKPKEKPSSSEKIAEMHMTSKSKTFSSCDAILLNPKTESSVTGVLSPVSNQVELCDPDHSAAKEDRGQAESPEAGGFVRRALSDGQFPLATNLSDTLDAIWTGENTHSSIRLQENGFVHPVSLSLESTTSSESNASITLSEEDSVNFEEKPRQGVIQAVGSSSFVKGLDQGDDSKSWLGTPLLSFYDFFDKNSGSTCLNFESLGDYNPVSVSCFRQLARQGGARLFLPIGFSDIVIPVYDDEPTSIISYALVSQDYHSQTSEERDRLNHIESSNSLPLYDSGSFQQFHSFDELSNESLKSFGSFEEGLLSMSGSRSSPIADPLLHTKAMHVRVSFADEGPLGKVKYTVTCYCARRFEALRRICCPSEEDFIRSLSRCRKWGAQGGKSNVFFAKTLDDRFIIKQVTKTELESFIKFAPSYFKYLSESIASGSPTCLAKILGIYQVTSKHLKGGKESRMDVLVMENLLFCRNVTRLYDLKGSSRSRYNPDSSGSNKVLLDQNLIEAMPTSPIFVGNKAKRLLERAVWNDTSFLASIDVMDYSLLVGVDEERQELVLGIIDFVRQYTWDKHLETWVKTTGILGGPKNVSPTVISPKQYKKRFRKAMSAYFLMVPDQWSPASIIPSGSQSDLYNEENQQSPSLE